MFTYTTPADQVPWQWQVRALSEVHPPCYSMRVQNVPTRAQVEGVRLCRIHLYRHPLIPYAYSSALLAIELSNAIQNDSAQDASSPEVSISLDEQHVWPGPLPVSAAASHAAPQPAVFSADSSPQNSVSPSPHLPTRGQRSPRSRTSLAAYLIPLGEWVNAAPEHAPFPIGTTQSDPVSLGLVTPEAVTVLFDYYFSTLNPLVALLDPALHTISETYYSSITLFSTILTVSARAVMPDRYRALHNHTKYLIGVAFAEGVTEIGLAQALSMLVFWKDPRDQAAFKWIGYAIRLAIELGLDQGLKRPLPEDERAARLVLNGERTWLRASPSSLQAGRPGLTLGTCRAYVLRHRVRFSCNPLSE